MGSNDLTIHGYPAAEDDGRKAALRQQAAAEIRRQASYLRRGSPERKAIEAAASAILGRGQDTGKAEDDG